MENFMQGQRTDIDQSPKAFLQRIKDKCFVNEKGCWLWKGKTLNNKGRPMCSWKHKIDLVYRHTFNALHGSPIKKGMMACHTCDEKTCCNPEHIFEGTNRDNILDFKSKNGEIKNGYNTGSADHYVDGRQKIDLRFQIPSKISDDNRFVWYRDKYCEITKDGCWIWLREVASDGYGRLHYKNKKHQSHRIMWMLANKKTPDDLEDLKKNNLVIGHMCPKDGPPNKACCNPEHLKVRSRSENAIDARSYSKSKKALHKDKEILEWLWIYDFVTNELGENHQLLKTKDGRRKHSFILKGLSELGLISDGIKVDYVNNTLRGKSNRHFHKEFFNWTPSWK